MPRVVIEAFRGSARIVGADENTVKVTGHSSISRDRFRPMGGPDALPIRMWK